MNQLVFVADNLEQTDQLGGALANHLPDGTCVALTGTLGAGKTRLVQAVAAASGIDPASVTSPTFVLCQPYHGHRALYHLDAYRLADLDEFFELGVEELLEGPGLCLIEWADRVRGGLPADILDIQIDVLGPNRRQFTLSASGAACQTALAAIQAALLDSTAADATTEP